MATRYEKLAVRYEATITIAAINQWRRALQTRPSRSGRVLAKVPLNVREVALGGP